MKGLWPAVSGSVAQSQRLDTIANNLANAETSAFKRDQVEFRNVLSDAEAAALKEDIPRKLYTDKDFHRLDGRDQSFVMVNGTHTDFTQGRVKATGSPLDVMIEGKGFLEVLGPQGSRFTRQGNLKLQADGTLVTTEGYPVLSRGGAPAGDGKMIPREELLARAIRIDSTKTNEPLTITGNGRIFQGKEQVGELSLVEFVDSKLLQKEGSSLYRNDLNANLKTDGIQTTLHQGMLEGSNVNAVAEMTELLKATRMFEANQKVVKNYGELESRAVNDIGKF